MSSVSICAPLKVEDPYNRIHQHHHHHHSRRLNHHYHHRYQHRYRYRQSSNSELNSFEVNYNKLPVTESDTDLSTLPPTTPATAEPLNTDPSSPIATEATTATGSTNDVDDHSMESDSIDDPAFSTPLSLTHLNVLQFCDLVYKALSNLSGQFLYTDNSPPVRPQLPNYPSPSLTSNVGAILDSSNQSGVLQQGTGPKLLHQLLIGVDAAQVRTRSQLSNRTKFAQPDEALFETKIRESPQFGTSPPASFDHPKSDDFTASWLLNQNKLHDDCNPIWPPNFAYSESLNLQPSCDSGSIRTNSPSKDATQLSAPCPAPTRIPFPCRPRSYSDLNGCSSTPSTTANGRTRARHLQATGRIHRFGSSARSDYSPNPTDSPSLLAQLVSKSEQPDKDLSISVKQSSPQPGQNYQQSSQSRQFIILKWLHEADLFVSTNCPSIPPGSLIKNCLDQSQTAVYLKLPMRKLWPQLLLVRMIETRFELGLELHPELGKIARDLDPATLDLSDQTLVQIMGSLSNEDKELSVLGDFVFLTKLHNLLNRQSGLERTPEEFDQIRLCILSQSAYPYYYSKSYTTTIQELQSIQADQTRFTQTLELLNQLHCFEPEEIRHFFQLSFSFCQKS